MTLTAEQGSLIGTALAEASQPGAMPAWLTNAWPAIKKILAAWLAGLTPKRDPHEVATLRSAMTEAAQPGAIPSWLQVILSQLPLILQLISAILGGLNPPPTPTPTPPPPGTGRS